MDVENNEDVKILWAAMLSMVHDIHTAQDLMTKEQWARAEVIFDNLEEHVRWIAVSEASEKAWNRRAK